MHGFHAPLPLDEFASQPIQQLGMGGRHSSLAEIAGRAHDALAEMMLPDAVHHDARGERVVGRGDPIGKAAPAIARFGVRRRLREWSLARGRDRCVTAAPAGEAATAALPRWRPAA